MRKENLVMKFIGAKIKERRERLGWSVTKLATLSEISQSFLSKIESGKVTGSWDTYVKIAGALGISTDLFFLSGSNVEAAPVDWRRIPILEYNQTSAWAESNYQIVPEKQETIMAHLEHPASTFAFRVRDDSMEPKFSAGDIVVIDPTVLPKPGDFVIAGNTTGEATFKQYRIAGINEQGIEVFELWPLNNLYAPMRSDRQPMAIVGTMVEHRSYRRR